jgi:RNA polymerase sigma-70 factor (ECF subfamily)
MFSTMHRVADDNRRKSSLRTAAAPKPQSETGRDRRWAGLIRLIADGDMEALSTLYDESSTTLFRLVFHILQDRQTAEETLILVYRIVLQKASAFCSSRSTAPAWLTALARNSAVQALRAAGGTQFEAFERRRRSLVSISGLTNEQSLFLQLTFLGGFTAGDVAEWMELSPEYVRHQIVTAMSRLRNS